MVGATSPTGKTLYAILHETTMDELKIDWEQERPNSLQLIGFWNSISISPIESWTKAAETLKLKISETHTNGGIQLHKFKISGNKHFDWFAQRNRLEEIDFLKNVLRHKDLSTYRNELEIESSTPKFKLIKYWTDIYDLPGELARILGHGGAYRKLDQQTAWAVSIEFLEYEFQNRFEEFNKFDVSIEGANWFYDIAWDYSTILFDKRNYELIFIDITDTD